MRRVLILSLFAVLMLTFAVGGCSEDSCKNLLSRLNDLQNQIIDIQNKRRDMDAAGKPGTANEAAQLKELEDGLRAQFATTAAEYIAKNCEKRTGEPVPSLPNPMPITETPF